MIQMLFFTYKHKIKAFEQILTLICFKVVLVSNIKELYKSTIRYLRLDCLWLQLLFVKEIVLEKARSVEHGPHSSSIIICWLLSTSSRLSLMSKHNICFFFRKDYPVCDTILWFFHFEIQLFFIRCYNCRVSCEMVFCTNNNALHVLAAGKISRRVSLIHYPEPSELKQNSINLKQLMAQRSSATTLTNSSRRFASPTQSTRTRSIMRSGSSSKSTKRKHGGGDSAKSNSQSVQASGKSGHSTLTSSGSFDQSQDQKSKKKRKIDGWSVASSVLNRIHFG